MKDGCTFCRREVPFEDEKPLRMTAFDAYGAFGLRIVCVCEYCDHLAEELEKNIAQSTKAIVEKFIEEHAKLGE